MERFHVEPNEGKDFLMGNGAGLFFLLPTKQCRNERHRENEIENPTRWDGVFMKSQKLLEGWNTEIDGILLSPELQTGFETDLSSAIRKFNAKGEIVEEVFIPHRLNAMALAYHGDFASSAVQPEFDIRNRYSDDATDYKVALSGDSASISAGGFFIHLGGSAVESVDQHRYKKYPEDSKRGELDERWVYSPVKVTGREIFFGFGRSLEEAKSSFAKVKSDLEGLRGEKRNSIELLFKTHALKCSNEQLNSAYLLAVHQLLSIKEEQFIPASGDRWFAGDDGWAADTAISLEAFFELGLFEDAKRIINFWFDEKKLREDGRLPKRLHPLDYSSSDATLWFLRRLGEYVNLTRDVDFFRKNERLVKKVFEGIRENYLSKNGLMRSGPSETWMDTKFTPREGYPIEVQALFIYDCLLFSKLFMNAYGYELAKLSDKAMGSLGEFKVKKKVGDREWHFLADCITPEGIKVDSITPNQLVALDCNLVSVELKKEILGLVREKLAGVGIRSLAPGEKNYHEKHTGDMSYHRGTQWPWLNYMAVKSELSLWNKEQAYKSYIKPLVDVVLGGNLGGVSELYNGDGSNCICPHYQTWSLASFIVAAKRYSEAK